MFCYSEINLDPTPFSRAYVQGNVSTSSVCINSASYNQFHDVKPTFLLNFFSVYFELFGSQIIETQNLLWGTNRKQLSMTQTAQTLKMGTRKV